MAQPNQEQHRISQVYLRPWSFKSKRKADTLCVMRYGDPVTFYQTVREFTAETNLFDTTLYDEGQERFFDQQSQIAETNFAKVLRALASGTYDGQIRIYLAEFASNLFVRQASTTFFLKFIMQRKPMREKLLREIVRFEEKDANLIELMYEEMAIDPDHSLDDKVSAVLLQAWKHFMEVFKRFNHVILKAPADRDWYASTNPVIVKKMGRDGYVVGTQAEIYFPISKECLVYMYLDGAEIENPLTKYPEDTITQVPLEVFDEIMYNTIIKSHPDFFIMSEDMGHVDVRDGSTLRWYRPDLNAIEDDEPEFSFLATPLPPSPDDPDLKRLLAKMNAKAEPVVVDVETHPDAEVNECIGIVDKMVRDFGGSRVLGWQVWKGTYLIEAEFHAVWKTKDGALKDVSKKGNKVTKILFVEDPDLVYDGTQFNNIRLNRFGERVVQDLIDTCDTLFKLYNKDGRSAFYGLDFLKNLTKEQYENLQVVEYFRRQLVQFLNDGGNEVSTCFCDRGRKYKDCHGLAVAELAKLD